jgi:ribose 5-phosphate isomerase A
MQALIDSPQDLMKRAAALRAVAEVEDGMVVGLGSGSTAAFALAGLAARVAGGLQIVGIPTSEATAVLARRLGIPLASFDIHQRIDLTIDGADQVERGTLNLIKGLGGALLREKIVAAASARLVVAVDESKLVDRLGDRTALPVEIVPFGWQTTIDRLTGLGCAPQLRRTNGRPFTTDGGNHIADCALGAIPDPAALEARLSAVVGVIETGLFIGMASTIMVGRPAGVEIMAR